MNSRGFLLFDIDGVIRDVSESYRRSIQETVNKFTNVRPSIYEIDQLKSEGIWNNDWDASIELISRRLKTNGQTLGKDIKRDEVIRVFNEFYFGKNSDSKNRGSWGGLIKKETLLVDKEFFSLLSENGFKWGFVSGAERHSAVFILEDRIGLNSPPLIAMGEAPEKPDPTGLINLASQLAGEPLGDKVPLIGYLGDTVADVLTIKKAKKLIPSQKFLSIGVAPPHLHKKEQIKKRQDYEKKLREMGADLIIPNTNEILKYLDSLG